MNTLKIARDFTPRPGPRYEHEGDNSGEVFRNTVLKPMVEQAISSGTKLLVDLDGTAGYATSFLEEAFGGLIRVTGLAYETVTELLVFKSVEEPYLIDDIKAYLQDANESKQ